MKVSVEIEKDKSHPENNLKKSQGIPKKSPEKSPKGKSNMKSGGRVLRSRSQEKVKGPKLGTNLQEHITGPSGENGREKKKNKKKKKELKNVAVDEFSRTRRHLKYLLHRMAYEQNLIDAYAGEGWKGQSAEKLRPEKELQRAKSEILRRKLKVRDLFQRIDSSLTEGTLPQALFDSEGEIDSEDIFCAKCGLKDVTLENDIILCDGACERAFHQFCVQPPLLKEDIPPDDEGWLCPGCNCKDDCMDLINESQGTNLSILDSWEKVYPEAAAAAGKTLGDDLELPSDDSEDNDYKPDELERDEKDEGDESSSDEDLYSASEDSEVAPANEQKLQLSSDDSEDDDFDPDAADLDEDVKQQCSSSDFTSSSEDLNALIKDNGFPLESSVMPDEFKSQPSKVGRGKRPLLNDEQSSLLETSTTAHEKSPLISVRREVERLDYKKLFDEQYGNVSTDSSDDEYFDAAADVPKRQRKNNEDSGKTHKRVVRKKLDTGSPKSSPIKLNNNKVFSEPGSSCNGGKSSAARKLGEAATQGLLISFKENQFPEQATKEKLAEELGITVHQVNNWFKNSRWNFRNSPHWESKLAQIPSKDTQFLLNQSMQSKAPSDCEMDPANEQNLQQLSSCSSEDDDFDPVATDVDEDIEQQSCSSEFTSCSEDLNAFVEVNESPPEASTMPNEDKSELSKVGRGKRPLLNDALPSSLVTATSQQKSSLISARRAVERLDYKKLYDEQYGNVPTDSSEDEYFDAVADAPKKRRKNNTDNYSTPKRKAQKKLDSEATNDSPVISNNEVPSEPGSSCSGGKASATKRLGEATIQGLLISFNENQFPEQATKEKLAEELGITVLQVNNWFRNSRWSFRNSPHWKSKLAQTNQSKDGVQTQLINQSKQSEEEAAPSDTKAHVPMDDTQDNTEDKTKPQTKRGRAAKGKKSASVTKRRK